MPPGEFFGLELPLFTTEKSLLIDQFEQFDRLQFRSMDFLIIFTRYILLIKGTFQLTSFIQSSNKLAEFSTVKKLDLAEKLRDVRSS